MKSNRAFTLVELLGVIAVLAVVMLIAGTNVFGISGKSKEKMAEENRANFKEAALTHVIGKITLAKCSVEVSSGLKNGNASFIDDNNKCMKKITAKELRDIGVFEDNKKSCADSDYVVVYRYNDGANSEYKAYISKDFCKR